MTSGNVTDNSPLWLLIEDKLQGLTSDDLSERNLEQTIQNTAKALDGTGRNVSLNAGNMLQLRWAVSAMQNVGRPMLQDFNKAVASLALEDVINPYNATVKIINDVGAAWPKLKDSDRKPDVLRIIQNTRLDLLVARARELSGETGIRFLIEENVTSEVIIEALGISQEEFGRVNAAVEAERAERTRVMTLIEGAEDKTEEDKVKHLINNDVADDLIVELAGVGRDMVDRAKQAMEEELKEKRRLEEEAAAKKKAEAEGPSLDAIPPDQLLEYIESIREILEFSDQEEEIRTMCGQSSIPKSVVDIAVSDPGKLDELEAKAEGS